MASDEAQGKVLPFGKRWRFPADLQRFRQMLDDDDVGFEESDIDDGLACAEAAIAKGVPGGPEVRADLLTIRGYRAYHADDVDGALARWAEIAAQYPTHRNAYAARADALEKRGEHEAAMAELDRYLERVPADPQGYLHRAKLYKARGDDERALANLRRATQLDGTLSEAHLAMAEILDKKGDKQGAARAYQKVAAEVYDDAQSYGMRAFMYFMSGQEELALADYENAFALDPNNADVLSWRALLRSRLGQTDLALADYTRLIAMRPDEARGYRRRGEILIRTGKPQEALRDLERAIALGGDNPGAAHCARGMAQQALGDLDAALASYEAAVEHDPANVAARLRLFQIYAERSEWDKCQPHAAAMLARSPDNTSLLLAHARVCRNNNQRDDALAAYDRLIALEPSAAAYHERAELQQGRGDTLAARADLARAFELAPDNPEIRAQHGVELIHGTDSDEDRAKGLALIASSAELDAQNPEAWARAASCFHRTARDKARAIPFITRALELSPDDPDLLHARAIYIRSARPWQPDDPQGFEESTRRALADVERALELCSDDDLELEIYSDRAELREDLGDLEGALADQNHLIEVAPDRIDSWMERARLRKRTGDMEGARADAERVRQMEEETIAELLPTYPEVVNIKRFNLDEA